MWMGAQLPDASESPFEVKYVPPAPPPPGKLIIKPRVQGQFPTLHLSPDTALSLADTIYEALAAIPED